MQNPITAEFHLLDPAAIAPASVCCSLSAEAARTLCQIARAGSGQVADCHFKWRKPYCFNTRPQLPGVMGVRLDDNPTSTVGLGGFAFTVARAEDARERVEGWLTGHPRVLDEAWDDANQAHPFRAQKPEAVPCLLLRTADVDPMVASPMRDLAINVAAAWLALGREG
jgi:hypothetical protein